MRRTKGPLGLSPDEQKTWTAFVQNVKPLPKAKKTIIPNEPPKLGPPVEIIPKIFDDIFPSKPRILEHQIDNSLRKALVRGHQTITARLDLHGFKQDQAYTALRNFIFRAYLEQNRIILVITGKGSSPEALAAPRGILKRMVPEWLRSSDISPLVIGFEDAALKHGGSGALYVWIRKRQESDR